MKDDRSTIESTPMNLVNDAAQWRLLGLLFERPVAGWAEQVGTIADEIDDAELRAAAKAAESQASLALYDSTFGPGGPAAPREVSYRRSLEPGSFIAELMAFYEAFGYHPSGEETPDHLATQLGFMSYLRLKQFYAQSRGEADQAGIAADAASHVVEEHLANIAEPIARSLAQSEIDYLRLAATVLRRRVGPCRDRAEGGTMNLLPLDDESDPTCGSETASYTRDAPIQLTVPMSRNRSGPPRRLP